MRNFRDTIARKRLNYANKLITFLLDKNIENLLLIRIIFATFQLLSRNVYILEHKDSYHHYIPQFLLRKFQSRKGLIYQYEHLKKPEEVSIRNKAACEFNLYVTTEKVTKKQSDFVEKQIFALLLERFASRIFNEFLSGNPFSLTPIRTSIVALFFAFQYTRTPKFLYYLQKFLEYLHLEKSVPFEEMKGLAFSKKVFFENIYNVSPAAFGKFLLKHDRKKMVGPTVKNLVLSVSFAIADHLASLINNKNLRMIDAKEPAFFYLSDNPASIFNLKEGRSVSIFLWEFNNDSFVCLPISPRQCLYYHSANDMPAFIAGRIIEDAIPKSIFQFAYSDRKDEVINSLFQKT
jgi:hypothetical protein